MFWNVNLMRGSLSPSEANTSCRYSQTLSVEPIHIFCVRTKVQLEDHMDMFEVSVSNFHLNGQNVNEKFNVKPVQRKAAQHYKV